MEKEVEIDLSKKYIMPKNLVEILFDNKFLIISVETANWIVLENVYQKDIFNELKNKTIEEVLEFSNKRSIEDEFISVLTQIEARKFTELTINNAENNGLCIYLTNKCNLRCKHCYMYAGVEESNELTTKEILNLVNDFVQSGGKVLTLTGGEVSERKDLVEILKYASSLGLLITVLTNGVNWDENLIDETYKYIDEIQVSVDGYDEESNSIIRGKDTFEKALRTINAFTSKKVKTSIAITPIYEELDNKKDKYINFAKRLIKDNYTNDFHVKFNYELLNGRDIVISKNKNKKYSKVMHEIVEACYPNSELKEFIINHKDNVILSNCGYGGVTVASNGDVFFCNRIHELKTYSNIRECTFEHIFELSNKVQRLSSIDNLKPCCDCELKYICGGGCRINYFNDLIKLDNLNATKELKPRYCDYSIKKKYYKLMIEANEYLFK